MEEKKKNLSYNTICGKLKSMISNCVIKIWSDHWRPTMTTNTEQSSCLGQTKLLGGLNVVRCGRDNGSLYRFSRIYSEILTFPLFRITFEKKKKKKKRQWQYPRPGYGEKSAETFCLSFGMLSRWAVVLMFDVLQQENRAEEKAATGGFQRPLGCQW